MKFSQVFARAFTSTTMGTWMMLSFQAAPASAAIVIVPEAFAQRNTHKLQAQPQTPFLISQSRRCEANNRLNEFAEFFISECRKASIRREFPSQYLYSTLGDIKSKRTADARKAWKLLNDNRFKK